MPVTRRAQSIPIVCALLSLAITVSISAQISIDIETNMSDTQEEISDSTKHKHLILGPLEIGPITGLTTIWHPAPDQESLIPLGSTLLLRQPVQAHHTVLWEGAQEIERTDTYSLAQCVMDQLDTFTVICNVIQSPGDYKTQMCVFQTTDYPTNRILVMPSTPTCQPLMLTDESPIDVALDAYFNHPFSTIHSKDGAHFVSAVNTPINLNSFVFPSGFAPLLEWRVNGEPVFIGANTTHEFDLPGTYSLQAGPPTAIVRPHEFTFETYAVHITSFTVPGDPDYASTHIPENRPVTFYAQTDPPGYENYIRWHAATKFGETFPVVGEGPSFTVEFIEPNGLDQSGDLWQWIGVRADSAQRGQDQKAVLVTAGTCPFPKRCIPNEDSCVYDIVFVVAIPGASAPCPNRAARGNTMCIAPCPPPVRGNCPFGVIVILDVDGDGTPDCRITANQGNAACAACPTGSLRVLSQDPTW